MEGADGSGKSTLARKLSAQFGAGVIHHGPYLDIKNSADLASQYLPGIRRALAGEPVIMDRSWLSEPIYGRVMRGKDRLLREHVRMLERCAMSADALVINCLPVVEVCLASFRARKDGEYPQREEQIRQIHAGYGLLQANTDLPVVEYDYMHDTVPVKPYQTPAPILNQGPGGGWWMPGKVFLLMGDRTNTRRNQAETARVPFVSFSHLGCSGWLAAELEDAGIDESELYWVNAYESDGTPTNHEFLNRLNPHCVFALGRRAGEWINSVSWGGAQVEVPHPQYHKRFHSRTRYPLIDEILRRKG